MLRERPAGPLEFRFPVETTGVELGLTKSGGLSLTSPKGKAVMSAPTPRMWDSIDPAAGGPRRETKVKTLIEKAGNQTVLVLKPDTEWLAAPDTRYPVTVDPTTTLGITQETTVRSPNGAMGPGYVARANYKNCPTPTTCAYSEWATRALMAFDTAPITGRQVVKATMQLSLNGNRPSCSAFQSVVAHRITQPWVADKTYWSNQPATSAEERSSVDACSQVRTDGAVWSWDLTAMTQAWARGTPNYGLTLRLGSELPVPKDLGEDFSFWNLLWGGPRVPKLSVDWVLPPEIPTVTAESIDSISGNDAIARSTSVKVTYKSSVPEATPLDYTVTVNDSTMPPPPVQLPTGETAAWKLDETSGNTATDSSGNGLNGTLTGTYSRIPGQLGGAVSLSPGAVISAGKPVINTNQSYTVATWVRLNSSTSDQAVLSQMGVNWPAFTLSYDVSDSAQFDRRWNFSVLRQDVPDRISEFGMQSEKLAKIGQWTHLAVQHDQTTHKFRLYVDGEMVAERDYVMDWNARGAFEVGRGLVVGNRRTLDGAVDDLRVYQRPLTGQEIRALAVSPNTTTHTGIPSGRVIDKTFAMDNPASFKFVVKACRTGVTPPSCNESPAYRISSDAPMLPTDTETGMADPAQPILSGMVNRPSGGPVIAKYYLYNGSGAPVGSAPLGARSVNGGERASFQLPANTVQPGTTYTWQMVACASGETAADEVCTSKTAPVSFTTPGTPPPPPVEDVRNLTLAKDSFVIKTARTNPTACNGAPCTVIDDNVMRIGGTGTEKTAAVIGFKLDELPDGAGVSEGILKLGTPVCSAGSCPSDAVITAAPLKSSVTSESKGSELGGDAETGTTPYALPVTAPQADIAGSEYQWLLLTSNKDDVITFADPAAAEQPSLALTYLPAGPPSKVLNLSAHGGDASATASWGLPESSGSVAMLDGYDVEVTDSGGTVVKTLEVADPWAAISGLTNDITYTIKVRAKTSYGVSAWETTTATTKAAPPPSTGGGSSCVLEAGSPAKATTATGSGTQAYIDRIKAYYQAQDAVLEGRANTIWDAPGVTPQAPSTAKLSLLNAELVKQRDEKQSAGTTRTGSAVQLTDPAVLALPDGTVRVTTTVERTWTESGGSSTSMAKTRAATSAGTVEGSAFTVSVFVFDRCGNITIIEAAVDSNCDPSDSVDDDSEGWTGGCSISGSGALKLAASECEGSVTIAGCDSDTELVKGIRLRVCYRSAWIIHPNTGPVDKWIISRMQAVGKIVVVGNSAATKKKYDYLLKHSQITIQTAGCARKIGASVTWGWGVRATTGGLADGDDCSQDEFQAGEGQAANYEDEDIVMDCTTWTCVSIKAYKHKVRAKAIVAYSKTDKRQKSNRAESDWRSYKGGYNIV
ncbi:LamG-like jellyroll fold domain-containing protein [Nonomuraea sp. NPDC049695]|uniref:LamG-like jellyroll fold domain-containing protein n=1 Tax=Nonomuraea sp. NPDC049695 TaxID=3154734 RepID=UPI0034346CA6